MPNTLTNVDRAGRISFPPDNLGQINVHVIQEEPVVTSDSIIEQLTKKDKVVYSTVCFLGEDIGFADIFGFGYTF